MKARRVIVRSSLVWLLLIAGSVVAGDKPIQQESLLTVPASLQEYYYGGLEPERLSYAIDLWYDAVLKCDDDLAMERQSILVGLLQQDVDSTGRMLALFDRLLVRAESDATRLDSAESLKEDYPLLERLDTDVYTLARDVYETKHRLLGAIRRSGASSNKYRLMSDYIEVLRREVGLPKLRLAVEQHDSATKNIPINVRVTGVNGKMTDN